MENAICLAATCNAGLRCANPAYLIPGVLHRYFDTPDTPIPLSPTRPLSHSPFPPSPQAPKPPSLSCAPPSAFPAEPPCIFCMLPTPPSRSGHPFPASPAVFRLWKRVYHRWHTDCNKRRCERFKRFGVRRIVPIAIAPAGVSPAAIPSGSTPPIITLQRRITHGLSIHPHRRGAIGSRAVCRGAPGGTGADPLFLHPARYRDGRAVRSPFDGRRHQV